MEYYEIIARILRTDKDVVKNIETYLGAKTGRRGVMDEIGKKNKDRIVKRLERCNLTINASAEEIYDALINRIEKDDKALYEKMGKPECSEHEGCVIIRQFLYDIFGNRKGLFLKKERFIELLEKEPPPKILKALGYSSVAEMMAKEDWREIGAALRFMEGVAWINDHLLPNYKTLTPSDFEERDLEIIALDPKWVELARTFVEKKYHNISHLKELGIIFIIPISLEVRGELIRTISLLCHYLNEVSFYSSLFAEAAKKGNDFGADIISLLRGDIVDDRNKLKEHDWLIIQRYLAKDDEHDWRLFAPHVSPEAVHWERAEHMISQLGQKLGLKELMFWEDLNWVGDYFKTTTGIDVLVSFNLIDTSMSLVKEKEMIKYLYHHQESLWNKIYTMYFGEEEMERMMRQHILNGFIPLS